MVLRTISSTLKCQFTGNVEKWTFRCHVRPNPAKVRENIFVCSVRSSRTPLDLPSFNLNSEKNSFCEKLDFGKMEVPEPKKKWRFSELYGKWGFPGES